MVRALLVDGGKLYTYKSGGEVVQWSGNGQSHRVDIGPIAKKRQGDGTSNDYHRFALCFGGLCSIACSRWVPQALQVRINKLAWAVRERVCEGRHVPAWRMQPANCAQVCR